MDATSRRPQLPALSYLDVDKVKREEEAYQIRLTGANQILPAVTAASPTYPYPPGPPPPYSQPPQNAWPGKPPGVAHTPPESRRTSAEEQESKQTIVRQSLPSISEALGVDSQTSAYTSTAPAATPLSSVAHQSSLAPSSPVSDKRSYGMEQLYSNTLPSYPQFRQDVSVQASSAPERTPLHLQTALQPPRQPTSYPPHSTDKSPGYDQPTPSSIGPPGFTYGYTPFPPRYAQPTGSTANAGPIYQPSTTCPAPSTPSSSWKSESASSKLGSHDRTTAPTDYSSSVKRHLEMYDLEGSLNEISQASSIMVDFSRRYGDRLHQTARAGPSLQTLPGIVEVDDMILKSRVQLDALMKIRDVVLTQQAAYEQQAADQRQQHKTFTQSAPPLDDPQDLDEAKAGFAGADSKKRRGRAAPPGRCHSCNRAETPEWRRGPDGARTLCNACGLHYAKLTRKQQGAAKSNAMGSSNLRPKEA